MVGQILEPVRQPAREPVRQPARELARLPAQDDHVQHLLLE